MLAATFLLSLSSIAQSDLEPVSFQREVLPILSDRCFACHGPDAEARDSDLRFDQRASVFGDLGGYAAVVPSDTDASELVDRITARFEEDRMPPVDSNLSLSEAEIETLRRWIEEGAEWQEHWAFVPPVQPELPTLQRASWPTRELDHFVLARMEAEGLAPNRAADPAALLRRVTLDLTGLPPTLRELDAFLADPSEAAYAAVVERLLASPRYGERMAWEWLDAARYADTDGFQGDPTRQMWPWRDWLVDQLNANTPFDQLTLEMLAGDLLPTATPEQVLASGFNRNHMTNGEGGRIFEETRVENVFDRVETTATTWMGLTYTCARCHDHKYDPISQAEYYQLYDFFNQSSDTGRGSAGRSKPNMRYLDSEQRTRIAWIEKELVQLEAERRTPDQVDDLAQQAWEAEARSTFAARPSATEPTRIEGGWWRIAVPFQDEAALLYARKFAPEKQVDLSEPGLWVQEPALEEGKVLALNSTVAAHYYFTQLLASSARSIELFFGSDDAIKVFLNGKEVLGKDVNRGAAPDQERVTVALQEGSNALLIKIVNTGGIGGVYFKRGAETIGELPLAIAEILFVPKPERSEAQEIAVMEFYRGKYVMAWQRAQAKIDSLGMEQESVQSSAPVVLVMDTLPMDQRRETKILERGGYDQPREAVLPGTPVFLPPLTTVEILATAETQPDRLDLAQWLVDPQHPLTARVTVNREWQRFFGRGLVATTEDFGRQGDAPSHPALLDFLARNFVDGGWNLKQLHREIVQSATYRQSASQAIQAYRDDPDNRLLTRGPRFRMPSWMIRDQALALAGLLVERQGGPPVRPYQPDGVWSEATFDTIRYQQDAGEALYRRSLYVFWRRIVQPTFFFDTAKRQTCSVRRSLTNSPLHALVTQNDPAYVEAARCFAQRALREGIAPFASHDESGAVEAALRWSFRAATSRAPSAEEQVLLLNRWTEVLARYRADEAAAATLIAVGESVADAALPQAELASMTVICSILLNLDEVLSKP
jgi:uncharacterized protein DUF1553/uncharacterized protein DUF1549/cytochrome c